MGRTELGSLLVFGQFLTVLPIGVPLVTRDCALLPTDGRNLAFSQLEDSPPFQGRRLGNSNPPTQIFGQLPFLTATWSSRSAKSSLMPQSRARLSAH
ncbi:MAG: hypothetical protein ACO3FE_19635 [Planctomycetaceae bacterium]